MFLKGRALRVVAETPTAYNRKRGRKEIMAQIRALLKELDEG